MSATRPLPRRDSSQSGFALILALLSLMLLTTLGLALTTSSSTEMQISTNQRWATAARFNAEAGLEYGKHLLNTIGSWPTPGADWGVVLPPPRGMAGGVPTVPWNPTTALGGWNPAGAAANTPTAQPGHPGGSRNWENWQCDTRGYGAGYGVVLDTGAGAEQFRSTINGVTLNGAFTLWVRRPVFWSGGSGTGTTLRDYTANDVLILVSEGVAPFTGATNNTAFGAANRAVYTVEALISGTVPTPFLDITAECASRSGQSGGGPQGTNSAGCVAIDRVTAGLVGATGVGTGAVQ